MSLFVPSKITKDRFLEVRQQTEKICEPLEIEDYVAQPVVDVSPPRWHIAHTTWFFEQFVLEPYLSGYECFDPNFYFLFNSYYVQAGERWQRDERGALTRPTVKEILAYRSYVNDHMVKLMEQSEFPAELIELGLHHEQQHQELLLYDIKYILGNNPLFPKYIDPKPQEKIKPNAEWHHVSSGNYQVGFVGDGFHFDNEKGAHTVFLHDYEISSQLVKKGEFKEFMDDGGYENGPLWLDEGLKWVKENEISSPMYWVRDEEGWMEYTMGGLQAIDFDDPLVHVSFYEADAFARWKGMRIPTEFEWEVAAKQFSSNIKGNFLENGHFSTVQEAKPAFFGNVWQWTSSAYRPYPFYKAPPGAIGEYNGKFMINQMVLRGGSFGTSKTHIRPTYRNFFHPHLRWHFAGMRLARDL